MTHGAPAPYWTEDGIKYVPPNYVYEQKREFKFGSSILYLPSMKINDDTIIYVLNIMGGRTDRVETYAKEMVEGFRKFVSDNFYYKITGVISAEGKSIPLVYEIAYLMDVPYIILRKSCKPYMGEKVLSARVKTITTDDFQDLYLDNKDLVNITGEKLVFVDDVISSGATLHACEKIANLAGGSVVASMVMAIEGDYKPSIPTFSLGKLPIIKLVKNE